MLKFFLWIVHCIAESLPISSSGHLALLRNYLAVEKPTKAQEHLMHLPTAIILALFLGNSMLEHLIPVLLADLITGLFYLSGFTIQWPLRFGFGISGLSLLSLYFTTYGHTTSVSASTAIAVGLAQSIALMPGVSRMAVTTVTGLWCGLTPDAAFMFSLACELPLILCAVVKAYGKAKLPLSLNWCSLVILGLSMIVSYELLSLMLTAFATKCVIPIGIYLCLLALL